MGPKESKLAKQQQIFKRTSSYNGISDKEIQELQRLQANIENIIEKMSKDFQSKRLCPNKIFVPLLEKLKSLCKTMDPNRPAVCYVIGNTDAGKSSLINAISNKKNCTVSHDASAGTKTFNRIEAEEANAVFIDTEGFSSVERRKKLIQELKSNMEGNDPPDVILLVVTRGHLKEIESLKSAIYCINEIVKWVKTKRYDAEIPIVCVLNKIDEWFPDEELESTTHDEKIKEHLSGALKKVNQYLIYKTEFANAVSSHKSYGIDDLVQSINGKAPLNAQIISKNIEYAEQCRFSIANKIIAAFSIASGAVSFIPLLDIVIITVFQEWMYEMLACFSTDPERTLDSFKSSYSAENFSNIAIRAGASIIGGVFQLSLIGYLVGSGVCVAAGSSSTAILGWKCYNYFTR